MVERVGTVLGRKLGVGVIKGIEEATTVAFVDMDDFGVGDCADVGDHEIVELAIVVGVCGLEFGRSRARKQVEGVEHSQSS